MTAPEAAPSADVVCPECKQAFPNTQELGKHRRRAHGVPGQSKTAQLYRRWGKKANFVCQDCGFVAKNLRGLAIHRKTHTKEIALAGSRPQAQAYRPAAAVKEEGQGHPNGIPDATLAVALGRFQGLCQGMALEYDLPPRLFATRLAELIYRATLR